MELIRSPEEARAFAVRAHGGQRYGKQPYVVHLDAVAALAAPYGEMARIVAYLHDVAEDTSVTIQEIGQAFGEHVAECVGLLTDGAGASRSERKAATYARLAGVQGAAEIALTVKAADRLANVVACRGDGLRELWEVYRAEHPAFRSAAFRPWQCDPLWEQLDRLLATWASG